MTTNIKNSKAPAGVRDLVKKPTSLVAEQAQIEKLAVKKESKLPRYKEKMLLDPEIEMLSMNDRPMIWRDLAEFAAQYGRTIADMVYDMVLLTNHAYTTKAPLRTVVPFDLEFLTRFYHLYPTSCEWQRPSIRDTFELMYGDCLSQFSKESEPVARLALGRRYAKMLGRVDTAQYRWLSEDGKITRRLGNILSKVEQSAKHGENPREVFESLGKRIWELRGFNIDKHFPLPTALSVLKPPGTRGRLMNPPKGSRPTNAPAYEGGAFG